jgi:hypothetical protein
MAALAQERGGRPGDALADREVVDLPRGILVV